MAAVPLATGSQQVLPLQPPTQPAAPQTLPDSDNFVSSLDIAVHKWEAEWRKMINEYLQNAAQELHNNVIATPSDRQKWIDTRLKQYVDVFRRALQENIVVLLQGIRGLKYDLASADYMQQARSEYAAYLEQAHATNTQLQETLDQHVQQHTTDLAQKDAEAQAMSDRIQALEQELAECRDEGTAQRASAEEAATAAQQQQEALTQQKEDLTQQLTETQSQVERAEEAAQQAAAGTAEQAALRTQAERDLELKRQEVEATQAHVNALQENMSELEGQLYAAQTEHMQANQAAADAQSTLEREQAEATDRERELRQLLTNAQEQLANAQSQQDELSNVVTQLQQQNEELERSRAVMEQQALTPFDPGQQIVGQELVAPDPSVAGSVQPDAPMTGELPPGPAFAAGAEGVDPGIGVQEGEEPIEQGGAVKQEDEPIAEAEAQPLALEGPVDEPMPEGGPPPLEQLQDDPEPLPKTEIAPLTAEQLQQIADNAMAQFPDDPEGAIEAETALHVDTQEKREALRERHFQVQAQIVAAWNEAEQTARSGGTVTREQITTLNAYLDNFLEIREAEVPNERDYIESRHANLVSARQGQDQAAFDAVIEDGMWENARLDQALAAADTMASTLPEYQEGMDEDIRRIEMLSGTIPPGDDEDLNDLVTTWDALTGQPPSRDYVANRIKEQGATYVQEWVESIPEREQSADIARRYDAAIALEDPDTKLDQLVNILLDAKGYQKELGRKRTAERRMGEYRFSPEEDISNPKLRRTAAQQDKLTARRLRARERFYEFLS